MEVENGRFYEELRKVVVIVECRYARKPFPEVNFDMEDREERVCAEMVKRFGCKDGPGEVSLVTKRFGGVIINQAGYVLTTAYAIPSMEEITLWKFGDSKGSSATIVHMDYKMNLALLKVEGWLDGSCKFSPLSDDIRFLPGLQIFSISHPSKMVFSFETGEVSYPYSCEGASEFENRTVGDLIDSSEYPLSFKLVNMEDEKHSTLGGMSRDTPLLQMSKFFGTLALSPWDDMVDPTYSDSEGAPIFDSRGKLVGIFAFTLRRMSFSIPIGVVQVFLKEALDNFPLVLQMATDMHLAEDIPSPTKNTALYNKMCEVVVMVECKRKFSNMAMQTKHFGGVVVNKKGYILVTSHALPSRNEDIVEMNIRKVGDETVWPAVCFAKDLRRGLALLKVEVKESEELCVFTQEECILPGKKIFCLSHLYGMPFSFECGEVSYPHSANGGKGKSSQNRTVEDVRSMWDDGGHRKYLRMADNRSSILESMDRNIPLLQMSKFTGSQVLCDLESTKDLQYDSQGTPIFGIEGEVVGIFAFSISKISFAIPFEVVKAFLSAHLPA